METKQPIILEAKGISKKFGGVRALSGTNITIRKGEIHALLGENGSGKSTLMKVLSGQEQPDEGAIYVRGKLTKLSNPNDALRYGIAMVAQEINLVPEISAAENIMLGRQSLFGRTGLVDWKKTFRYAREALEMLGAGQIDPGTIVSKLPIDLQQIVEIARAMSTGADVVILDEPTSALTVAQSKHLFGLMNRLSKAGKAIIFISHKINEILEHCDHVTILRDGVTTGDTPVSETDANKLVNLMVGREVGDFYYKRSVPIGDKVLELSQVSFEPFYKEISMHVRKGEIVGLYGLDSAGHKEVLESCFGLHKRTSGKMMLNGKEVDFQSPREAIKSGLAYVPADRKLHGGVLTRSVEENLLMVENGLKPGYEIETLAEKKKKANALFQMMNIRRCNLETLLSNLSGGNQQKAVFGKWILNPPDVFLLNDPTRGIDIPAKKEIYYLLSDLAEKNCSIILISTDLPELLSLADRVYVMFKGRVVRELTDNLSEEEVMQYATGSNQEILV